MIIGIEQAIINIKKVELTTIEKMKEKSAIAGNVIADKAREIVPKRTRELMRSIHSYNPIVKFTKILTEIKAEKFYALFVELGTVKMKAEPYLSKAVKESLSTIKNIFHSLHITK